MSYLSLALTRTFAYTLIPDGARVHKGTKVVMNRPPMDLGPKQKIACLQRRMNLFTKL